MMAQLEQSGGEWNLVKADILRGRVAHCPTAGLRVSGSFGIARSYPGCPVCGKRFVCPLRPMRNAHVLVTDIGVQVRRVW